MKLLLKNADILYRTEDGYKVIEKGCLGIDDEYISFLGQETNERKYDEVKDMSGKLLMAGLINAHCHAPMALLRGFGSGRNLQDWLYKVIIPMEDKFTPDDIRVGAFAGALELIAGGTTCFSEMYDFPWAEAGAIEISGLKCNITRTGLCFDKDIDPDNWPRTKESEEFVRDYKHAADRVRSEFSFHSEYMTTDKFTERMAEVNRKYQTPVNIHISETFNEHEECVQRHGCTPIAYFDRYGVFENTTYAAHCVWVTDDDLKIMKEKGVSLVHNPSSNMKLGSGFAPVVKAMKMGINVALGTDGAASNNNLNMFEEMHLASILHNGYLNDSTAITADQILDMATINGAKALQRLDTGVLEVGKKADIIALDMSAPHLHPAVDIPALIVYSAQASDVCMTMVDGHILYEDGKFFTLDKEKILIDLDNTVARLTKM